MKYGLLWPLLVSAFFSANGTPAITQFMHRPLVMDAKSMHKLRLESDGTQDHVEVNVGSALVLKRQKNSGEVEVCSPVKHLLPTLVEIVVVLIGFLAFRWRLPSSDSAECARSIFLLHNGLAYINFSIVILDAYSLAATMGQGPAFSGAVIGVYMMGIGIGGVAAWTLFKVKPFAWKKSGRSILMMAQCFQLVGAIGYTLIALAVTYDIQVKVDKASAMIASRLVMGVGAGVCTNLAQVSFIHLTPKDDRPKQMVRFMLANMTGIALGPLLAAAQGSLDYCAGASPHGNRFELVGVAKTVNCLGMITAVILWYPRMQSVEDNEPAPLAIEHSDLNKRIVEDPRTWVLTGCIMVNTVCPLCISALESATSFLLETDYNWNRNEIGIMISMTFLTIAPLRCAYVAFKDKLSDIGWIRLLSAGVVIGSLLMISKPHTPWKLIIADSIMFPCLCWVNSLAVGIAQQHLFPQGSWLDASNFVLVHLCAGNLVSRTLGPVLGRIVSDQGGQSMYGVCQLLGCLLYVMLVEVFITPNLVHGKQGASDCIKDTGRSLPKSASESSLFEGKGN